MVNYDTEEETTEEVVETDEVTYEEETEADVEETEEEEIDYKAKYEEEAAARKKAELAIIKAKSKPKEVKPKVDVKLSTFDLLALQKANIDTEEDLEEVTRWAGYNGISVAEALKSNILKATLAEKQEQRNSAMAVNIGGGRRASNQVSDERLIADAEKGIMPDSDADLARLTKLRLLRK